MVLHQEELQLALFKTPSGENLFLDRVSIYCAFLFVFVFIIILDLFTTPYTALLHFFADYPQNIYIACCQHR
jgi:hypothetical protein